MQSLRPDLLFRGFLSCCPFEALLLVILTFGADKYTKDWWCMWKLWCIWIREGSNELEIVMSGINKIYTEKEL